MNQPRVHRPRRRWVSLVTLAALAIAAGGCAIDGGQLITDVVQAGLESVTGSLVDALSAYMAGH